MVSNPGTPAGPGGVRPLNQPRPAAVESDPNGRPKAVIDHGVYRSVTAIDDIWRIDDEWWRDEISRRYFAVELENGRRLTLFHDIVHDAWYQQTYTAPGEAGAIPRKNRR